MGQTHQHGITDQPGVVGHLLHFGGADTVARSLQLPIAPAGEKQKTFLVTPDGIAGPHCTVALHERRRRPKTRRRGHRVAPIALADQRTGMHQFTRFTRRTFGAVFTQHAHIGIGNGFTDAVRVLVNVLGGKISTAESLGKAIHQEHFRPGPVLAQFSQYRLRQHAAGIGDIAQMLTDASRPVLPRQRTPQWRHTGQTRDALARDYVDHIAG